LPQFFPFQLKDLPWSFSTDWGVKRSRQSTAKFDFNHINLVQRFNWS